MMPKLSLSLSLLTLLVSCGEAEPVNPKTTNNATNALVMAADPGEAAAVIKAKAAGPSKEVIIEGRIFDITKGFALMKMMDLTMDYCGELNKEQKCPTPWDFCCDNPNEITANSLLVKAVDASGETLEADSLANLRLLDIIKVKGELIKDEFGNLVLVATGWFRAERPEEIRPALEAALAADKVAVVHVPTDPKATRAGGANYLQ